MKEFKIVSLIFTLIVFASGGLFFYSKVKSSGSETAQKLLKDETYSKTLNDQNPVLKKKNPETALLPLSSGGNHAFDTNCEHCAAKKKQPEGVNFAVARPVGHLTWVVLVFTSA